MTKIISAATFAGVMLGVLIHAGAADATSFRTWVSGAGDDGNPCTRSMPCRTFQVAYGNATNEIDVLDGGDFGSLTITKPFTIANDGAGTAAVTLNASDHIIINAGSGDFAVVVLRGLSIIAEDIFGPNAIEVDSVGSLLVDHCTIQGYIGGPGIAVGTSTPAKVWIKDTVFLDDGAPSSASIAIVGQTGATATVHLERVQILKAVGNAIRVDGTGGAAADVELRDVTVDSASGGSAIVAVSNGVSVKIVADNVTVSHNPGYGLRAVGAGTSVAIERSTIESNGVGVSASGGGQVFSFGDNHFVNNTSDGSTPTPIGLK